MTLSLYYKTKKELKEKYWIRVRLFRNKYF